MAIPIGKKIAFIDVSVANDLSNVVDIRDAKFISLILPTLDGPACNITFEVSSVSDGPFVALKKVDGTDVTVTGATGGTATQYIEELAGYCWFKIKTSVVQTVDRKIEVCFKE